jgi:hypothetical protein
MVAAGVVPAEPDESPQAASVIPAAGAAARIRAAATAMIGLRISHLFVVC